MRMIRLAGRGKQFLRSVATGRKLRKIYAQCRDFTVIPEGLFVANLRLIESISHLSGCVVECGVWRGGMSSGMAFLLGPDRTYYLFDSFEGLPAARPIDGEAPNRWQQDRESPEYYDNCTAPQEFAITAMTNARATSFRIVKGWFDQTLPETIIPEPIAVLRLDADWYDSTTCCLENLFHKVRAGGIVVIDDYYTWDGCSRAVHDFLSRHSRTERIRSLGNVAYIVKQEQPRSF